ncbi:MAG: hypothetical protein RLZZ210_85 [Pseudomonadota bacterium]
MIVKMTTFSIQTSLAPFGFSYSNLAPLLVGSEYIRDKKNIDINSNKKLLSLSKPDTRLVISSKIDFENHISTIIFSNNIEDINSFYSTTYNLSLPALYALTATGTNAKDLRKLLSILKKNISPTELQQAKELAAKIEKIEKGIQTNIDLRISLSEIQIKMDKVKDIHNNTNILSKANDESISIAVAEYANNLKNATTVLQAIKDNLSEMCIL